MPPELPGLPKIRLPESPLSPLRKVLHGSRQQIEKVGNDIRSIAEELHGGTPDGTSTIQDTEGASEFELQRRTAEPGATPPGAKGTACLPCSRDHLSTTSSALSEGIRFARDKGVKDHEVMRRIRIGLDELNAMERIDLAPEETAKLKGAEKELADWVLRQSRDLRHAITEIRDADTLEQAAARASTITEEFMTQLWAIPEGECETCGELRDRLKEFVEKKKRERTQEPKLTLEEAKKLAAEEAGREVERRW
ncbi:hypothetical protein ES707_04424 [subsurface metagenome]